MDLAQELGMTVSTLRESMSERELRTWMRYAGQKGLRSRRVELQLAMNALAMSVALCGKNGLTLADFLFDSEGKKAKPPSAVDAAMALSGGGARKLGQGRKRKGN
jgi:hypothetical protein